MTGAQASLLAMSAASARKKRLLTNISTVSNSRFRLFRLMASRDALRSGQELRVFLEGSSV